MTDKQYIKRLESLVDSQETLIAQLQRALKQIAKVPVTSQIHDSSPTPITQMPVIEPKEEEQIPHVIQELKSVMKLSNEELLDQMFPIEREEAS